MYPDELLDALGREPRERHVRAEAGVVHEQIDVGTFAGAPLDAGERGRVAEIGRDDLHGDARIGPKSGGELLEPPATPRDDDEVIPVARETLGEGTADARGRPRDEGDAQWFPSAMLSAAVSLRMSRSAPRRRPMIEEAMFRMRR